MSRLKGYNGSLLERFRSKFIEGDPNECWEWAGSRNSMGYGDIRIDGCTIRAHRLSWEIYNDLIPPDIEVLHKCNNRACVNPNHLYLGSQAENLKQMVDDGRCPVRAKLYDEEIAQVRALLEEGFSFRRIEEVTGVGRCSVNNIKKNPNFPSRGSFHN